MAEEKRLAKVNKGLLKKIAELERNSLKEFKLSEKRNKEAQVRMERVEKIRSKEAKSRERDFTANYSRLNKKFKDDIVDMKNEIFSEMDSEIQRGMDRSSVHKRYLGYSPPKKKPRKPLSLIRRAKLKKLMRRIVKLKTTTPHSWIQQSGFGGVFIDYVIDNNNDTDDVLFLKWCKPEVERIVKETLPAKYILRINCTFSRWSVKGEEESDNDDSFLSTKQTAVSNPSDDIDETYRTWSETLSGHISRYMTNGSGWYLNKVNSLHIQVSSVRSEGGNAFDDSDSDDTEDESDDDRVGKWVELPKWISIKGATQNIRSDDEMCLKWSITRSLNPISRKLKCNVVNRELIEQSEELCWDGMAFPSGEGDFKAFEIANPDIKLIVYVAIKGDATTQGRGTFRVCWKSNRESEREAIVLKYRRHVVCVTNESRLVSCLKDTKHHGKSKVCRKCGCVVPQKGFETHESLCGSHKPIPVRYLDPSDKVLCFRNYERSFEVPIRVYCDFESITEEYVGHNKPKKTRKTHKHLPCSFSIRVVRFDGKGITVKYTGLDSAIEFVQCVIRIVKEWALEFEKGVKLCPKDVEKVLPLLRTTKLCHICGEKIRAKKTVRRKGKLEEFVDVPVLDHCHYTGRFRGVAHSRCNLRVRRVKFVPFFMHNFSGYDSHLIIRELCDSGYKGDVSCLCRGNDENFITINKKVPFKFKKDGSIKATMTARFLDSYNFIDISLAKIVSYMDRSNFNEVKREFGDGERFNLMIRKGVYPYSHMSSFSKIWDKKLPPKLSFYNDLTRSHITDEDYEHAKTVWSVFECKTMRDYCEVYVLADSLLLADSFEYFRRLCLKVHKVDPAHRYTKAGIAWDSALKGTNVHLDLFDSSNSDMSLMIERGIRGGVSMVSHRHGLANHKYLDNFNPNEPSVFLLHLDCVAQYSWAMSRKLPIKGFEWMDTLDLENWSVFGEGNDYDMGCILDVNLKYPRDLHDLHNDFPLAPERMVVDGVEKLVPNLRDKENYIIHVETLKCYARHGLIVTRVNRGIKFYEEAWLKPYIDLNSMHRRNAKNEFENKFFKFLNNGQFGKLMENVRGYVDVRIDTNTQWHGGARSV